MTWTTLITRQMQATGLTQTQLAKRLTDDGVPTSPQAIQRYLRGTAAPGDNRWVGLVRHLQIAPDELLEVTGVAAPLAVARAAQLDRVA